MPVRLFNVCDPNDDDCVALADFMVETAAFVGSLPDDEPIYCDHFLNIIEDLLCNDSQQARVTAIDNGQTAMLNRKIM